MSYESAELYLSGKGLVLLDGDNKTDSSAGSNGAGKSSIADAFMWCLTATTARGMPSDSIVNGKAGGDCCVTLSLQKENVYFRITRHRKRKKGKSNIVIVEQSADNKNWTDISKGTDRLTQDLIEKIIGCNKEVLLAAVYAAQNNMLDLPGMTDSELKAIVENAAGIDAITKARDIAKGKIDELKSELQVAEARHENIMVEISGYEMSIENLQETKAEFDKKKSEKIRLIKSDIFHLSREHQELEMALLMIKDDVKKAKEFLSRPMPDKVNEKKILADELYSAKKSKLEAEKSLRIINSSYADWRRERDSIDKDIISMAYGVCPVCGSEDHNSEQFDDSMREKQERLKNANENIERCAEESFEVEDKIKQFEQQIENLRNKIQNGFDDIKYYAQKAEAEDSINDQECKIDKLKDIIRAIEGKKAALKDVENSELDISAKIDSLENSRNIAYHDAKFVEATVLEIKSDLEKAQQVHTVFSPKGVRAEILDKVTPFLNERTNYYLSILSDGNIQVEWNTQYLNSLGEISEKFNIELTSEEAAVTYRGLSGGEKKKVILACNFALRDLVIQRSNEDYNIFFGDEIDHGLSGVGLEKLMSILSDLAETTIVISQHDLSGMVDQIATVEKVNGVSRIHGVF